MGGYFDRRPKVTFPLSVIKGNELSVRLWEEKLECPLGLFDYSYYYTDSEGWGRILYDLVFESSLYREDRFDCENYALKCMTLCAERYGLNTMAMVIGDSHLGRHAWNIFYTGGGFMCFEPNLAFPYAGEAFKIGEHGYKPEVILI